MSATAQAVTKGAKATVGSAMVALHPAVALHNGDNAVGPLAPSQPMHVVVTLKLRNEAQLDQYIAKSGFKLLSPQQFQALYGPTAAQAQAVADYLTRAGFSNVKIAAGNSLVEADGHATAAQAAFNTSFVHVKTHDGRDAFANNSAVQVPASLQGVVHGVLGVQNVHVAHTFAKRYQPSAVANAMATPADASGVATAHQPSDFPSIYGASGMPNVTTVPVGSISAGAMRNVLSDLKSTNPGVTVTLAGNTTVGSGSGANTSDDEFDLDAQVILAFTGAKQYYFYVAASLNDADLQTAYAKVVSDNILRVIDVSLGECETDAQTDGTAASDDTTFKQAVAQGQTFFVSSGDKGGNECNGASGTTWPASSQYVTAVGGTEVYTSPNTIWQSELTWNNLSENEGASSSGISSFEPMPSWQLGIPGVQEINVYDQGYRVIPDIAFDASPDSGALITVDGKPNKQYGGTSLSAPLAAGMWAHVLQADGIGLGFASPVIYTMAKAQQSYSSAFHDITYVSTGCCNGGRGWDLGTGWGSVIVNQFAKAAVGYSPMSTFVSFATLPALQATTPIPGSAHVPGDFNGDGSSDLLWFNPMLSQIGIWTMTAVPMGLTGGGVIRTGESTYNVTPGYFVGAVGDFNSDGYADLVFTSPNRDLYLWTNNQHGGWTSARINNAAYPAQWQLIGAGDVDGDGYDDLLWLDPSECKFGYWTMKGATVTGYHTVDITCGSYPVSIGYYTPSNRLSIVWTDTTGTLSIWDSNGSSTGTGFNVYSNIRQTLGVGGGQIASFGGGYQGQNMGAQVYGLPATEDANSASGFGSGNLATRFFDANGNQTSVQSLPTYGPIALHGTAGSAGYVIVGRGINNTGVYTFDSSDLTISTGGLLTSDPVFTGNAPDMPGLLQQYAVGDEWNYPSGWWVVGALYNGAVTPPW